MLDVAVIGGGPVGSRLAYKLAMAGYRIRVFEKRKGIGEKPCCTGIVSRECVSTFDIQPEVIFKQVNSAKLFPPSGEFIRIYRPETQACIINRSALDRELARKSQLQGVDYQLNSKVINIIDEVDGVRVEFEESGKLRQCESRAAVLTTGFNAPLVKRLGFGQSGDFVAGAQAEVQVNEVDEVEVYFNQKMARGFFAWIVPTTEGRCLVGLMSRKSPGYYLRDWLTKLAARGKIVPDKYQIHYGGIPIKPLARTVCNKLLVVGDAAGQVKSTTGGGLFFGMLCADIAADTLHNALETGDLSTRQLSRYERGWRKKLGNELRREYFVRKLYHHLSDKQIDRIFSQMRSAGIVDSLLRDTTSFDWHGGLMVKILKTALISQSNRLLAWPIVKRKRTF